MFQDIHNARHCLLFQGQVDNMMKEMADEAGQVFLTFASTHMVYGQQGIWAAEMNARSRW